MKITIMITGDTKGYRAKNAILRFFKPSEEKILTEWIKKNFNDWKYEIKRGVAKNG